MTSPAELELGRIARSCAAALGLESTALFDPLDLRPPDDEQLLHQTIVRLRKLLRFFDDRWMTTGAGLDAMTVLALALALRGTRRGRFTEAYEAATSALKWHGSRAEAWRLRGQIAALRASRSKKWVGPALDDLTRALVYDPRDVASRWSRAVVLSLSALDDLDRASRRRERPNPATQRLVAEAETTIFRAIEDLDAVLEAEPRLGSARLRRGLCAARVGLLERAAADLEELCDQGLDSFRGLAREVAAQRLARASLEASRVLSALGRSRRALEVLGAALELGDEDDLRQAQRCRARLAERVSDHQALRAACTALLDGAVGEEEIELRVRRARALRALGELELARSDASRALRLDESCFEARWIRARCAVELEAYRAAFADLERCLEARPESVECWLLQAHAARGVNDRSTLLLAASRVRELADGSGSPEALSALAELLQGTDDEAE